MDVEKKRLMLGIGIAICGYLYVDWILFVTNSYLVTIFAIVICLVTGVYMTAMGHKQNQGSWSCLVVIFVSALYFAIGNGEAEKLLNLVFLSVMFVYWVALTTRKLADNKLSVYIIGDVFSQMIITPFANFGKLFVTFKDGLKFGKTSKSLVGGLLGVVIIIPVLIWVINLLAGADLVFSILVDKIFRSFSYDYLVYLGEFIISIPVSCYLFGVIYGDTNPDKGVYISKAVMEKNSKEIKIMPQLAGHTGLTLLNCVYIIFFVSQISYMLGAFKNILPEGFTYAEYAREGFFQLVTVSVINLCVILGVMSFVKNSFCKEEKYLRIQLGALAAFTLMLTTTVMKKMYMYIDAYGLTELRVYTSWFMVLLFMIFVIIFIRQINEFNATKVGIVAAILWFLMFIPMG